MAKLELKNINKTYDRKTIPVKNVSLSVDDGEFLTLLGPSGCGKSTTLRLIAGLEEPTRGQILIGDRDVTALRPGDRNISMVFQSYALYPHMTVYENMASPLKLRNTSANEIEQRIARASEFLDLNTDLMHKKPGQLSGGQRQRVALGRALVRNPDVFLLDEPLSNLDALLRERVRAEIKQLFEQQNAPVVYVTHDQVEAMTLSTKVAVLYEGNLQQLDPPGRLYTHPANQFVAGFVGSPQMNLLTLRCKGHSAELGNLRVPLPPQVPTPPHVVLGIRPEDVRLCEDGDALTLPGRIFLVENLGMQNLLSVRVAGAGDNTITLRALLPADRRWEGDDVVVAIVPDRIHWFDADTGDRLA
ncbi:ABC transporter ATP-binding protein [Oscillatoriales cyanobacterium LEGE 11467]|uniref:ABC transporter ATP-binding protein n=1 Tax=Zarconia navalis LEGE 11467 TaxID=1828826 RepID=A0A928VWN9_9CYAN|nr:ABC transporter ATP-binding protein [Zarconia navalis]MBE9040919.1 ABC transporter ATP-binding protein [Zarconia navalis LEGE 11467]